MDCYVFLALVKNEMSPFGHLRLLGIVMVMKILCVNTLCNDKW